VGDQLPKPVHRQDEYMVAMCQRLDAQTAVLSQILDRLPAPATTAEAGQPVEIAIREPAAPGPSQDAAEPPGDDSPASATTTGPTRRAVKKAPAKSAAAKKGVTDG
jgi:hypothetical protein